MLNFKNKKHDRELIMYNNEHNKRFRTQASHTRGDTPPLPPLRGPESAAAHPLAQPCSASEQLNETFQQIPCKFLWKNLGYRVISRLLCSVLYNKSECLHTWP